MGINGTIIKVKQNFVPYFREKTVLKLLIELIYKTKSK
jgi:hypothetical protein